MTDVNHKEIGLAVTSVIASFAFFSSAALALLTSPYHIGLITIAAVLAVLWVIVAALTLALAEHWPAVTAVWGGAAAAAIVAGGASWGSLGGGLLLALFCGGARQTFQRSRHTFRAYRTNDIFRAGTRLLITGIIFATVSLALPFVQGSLARGSFKISPEQTELFLRPFTPLVKDLLPNIQAASSVDDLIDNQLRREGIDPQQFSESQRAEVRQRVSEQLAIPVDSGDTSLSTIVADRLNATFTRVTQTSALTVALVAVILIFLTLRAFIPLMTWFLLGALVGVVWLATKANLLTIKKETIEVETLTLEP